MFRTVSDPAAACWQAVAPLAARVEIEHVLEVPPVKMRPCPGFETAVFPYTTDMPFLTTWGRPLLFGPGSIHVAHTADEIVADRGTDGAVDRYVEDREGASGETSLRPRAWLPQPTANARSLHQLCAQHSFHHRAPGAGFGLIGGAGELQAARKAGFRRAARER